MKTFAERLKMALDKIGISQAEAARRCNISQQSINYIISNNLEQSKLAVKIASSLDINPEWLIYGVGKFKETTYYEIPVLNSAFQILKFINNDLDIETVPCLASELYFGELIFAYLVEPNELAICCQKEYTLPALKYLCIVGSKVEITKEPLTDLFFGIIEWRKRCASFSFSHLTNEVSS